MHSFFATTAKGMEELLAAELRALAAEAVTTRPAGVAFTGSLEVGYRACLWSRVANRILLPLASFPAETPEALYAGVRSIRWSDHLGARQTLAVDFAVSQSASPSPEPSLIKSVDKHRAGPSRRPRKDGASSGRTEIVFEIEKPTVRPEEPPSSGGVSKGVLATKSTVSPGRGRRSLLPVW